MIDRILSIIERGSSLLTPVFILTADRYGIILRFGNFHRRLAPGLHFKIPLIETVMTCDGRVHFYQTNKQSLVTADGQPVVVSAIMSFVASSAQKAILKQEKFGSSVWDGTAAAIAALVSKANFADLSGEDFSEALLSEVQAENEPFGTRIITCRLQDVAKARTYRVLD